MSDWVRRSVIDPLRRFRGKYSQCVGILCAILLILVGLATISLWCAQEGSSDNWLPDNLLDIYFGFAMGICMSLAVLALAIRGFPHHFAPLKHAIQSRAFWGYLIIAVGCGLIVLLFAASLKKTEDPSHRYSLLVQVERNPGGLFTLVTGIATVVALFYTWQGLSNMQRSISSFSELIDRVCRIAKKATADDPLKILAYTPAIGFLAQPINDWNRFRNALDQKPSGQPIADIICLREADLDVWHRLFVGRRTLRGKVELKTATDATQAANNLVEHLSEDSLGNPASRTTVRRLPWRFMPGFYLFITRERAIIVTPMFMPFPKGAPKREQENLPTVQMIGLETQDRAVIRDAQCIFQYYMDLPEALLGESHLEVDCTALLSWLDNTANADDVMKTLREQLIESLKRSRNGIDAELREEPSLKMIVGLDAHIKTW